MPRVKLFEHSAKRILSSYGFGPYAGFVIHAEQSLSEELQSRISALPSDARYIVKIDQGVKQRMKKGLVCLDVMPDAILPSAQALFAKGYSRVLVEPHIVHTDSEEKYLSLDRTGSGVVAAASLTGGIDIEQSKKSITRFVLDADGSKSLAELLGVSAESIGRLVAAFDECHFSYLEINPLLVKNSALLFLDCAVLADSAGQYFSHNRWTDADVVPPVSVSAEEFAVEELNRRSQASFSLRVLKPDGSIFLLLSGGGASIVIADEVSNLGAGKEIANYGEYSGNPSEDEAYAYAKAVLSLLEKSCAARKVMLVGGGVANFTDIRATFRGIIRAINEAKDYLREHRVKVYVRRGGPHAAEALSLIAEFLSRHSLLGGVHGPELPLHAIAAEALELKKEHVVNR